MTEELVDRAPRVRCYECGSDRVFAVCHHCQRPMCDHHSPLAYRQGGTLVRMPGGSAEEARPASKELAGLHLGGLREAVYHCKDHVHMVRGSLMPWVYAGAGAAVLGLLLLCVAAKFGLFLILTGGLVGGGAWLLGRAMATRIVRPPLPLVPQVNTVELLERLAGYVRLEDGEYTSTVESLTGQLTAEMSANEGHAALRAYRRKFGVPAAEPVPFSGGYLMLQGDVGLAFRAGQAPVLSGGTGVSIGGESADEHELFPADPQLPQRESTLAIDYEVQDRRSPREIPLWIVPSLVPASDRRALEIDLHWNRLGPEREQRLSLAVFDLIELEVPASWGTVESSAPGQVAIGRSGGRRTIRWKQLPPPQPGARSLTLQLRFERPITEVPESTDPDDDGSRSRLTLSGKVEATFEGLLSGVTGVGVYLPGGGPGHSPRPKTQTKVAVTFDASLRSIRYQDDRVVPDENHESDLAQGRHRADEFHGVLPDSRTVAELTNAISSDGYYVKSVVEHPPFRDDVRMGVVNRVWDIAGRMYVGLFPMDFDINLRGDEMAVQDGFTGNTVVQVTVKGAYAKGTLVDSRESSDTTGAVMDLADATVETDLQGDELLRRIEDTWVSLHTRVTDLLAARAERTVRRHALPGAAEKIHHGELVDTVPEHVVRADPMPAVSATAVPMQTGSMPTVPVSAAPVPVAPVPVAPVPVASNGGPAPGDRRAELVRQREAADDAVINGRINEDTHGRIVARIESELSRLEASR
ncbi:hypothetical protein ACQEVZ_23245 [Dactylosporangium sp. CA-152071]|uniref:hypothetical protein n=1 Tax=Dactylosporangium sp. CA-152071 TaxID=3239933 RepID=UPI003D8D7E35